MTSPVIHSFLCSISQMQPKGWLPQQQTCRYCTKGCNLPGMLVVLDTGAQLNKTVDDSSLPEVCTGLSSTMRLATKDQDFSPIPTWFLNVLWQECVISSATGSHNLVLVSKQQQVNCLYWFKTSSRMPWTITDSEVALTSSGVFIY